MGRQLKKMRLPNGVVAEKGPAAIMSVSIAGAKPLPVISWLICAFRYTPAIRACAGLILRLRSMWVMSRIAALAITRAYPGSAGMKAGLPWGRVSD